MTIHSPVLGVAASTLEKQAEAQELAKRLDFGFIPDWEQLPHLHDHYLLMLTPHHLGLRLPHHKSYSLFYIDFLSEKMQHRRQQAGLRKELLARAMGCKPGDNAFIIDATAGLGRDSFILACLGFQITLLERSAILHALLEDALKRAGNHPSTATIISRMHLIHIDAITWLQNLDQKPAVIYLDPMFPTRKKAASVKKDMAITQDLLGKDQDAHELFKLALTCATKRVVVKRPRLAANLADLAPSFSLAGRSSRFDIYLIS